MRCSGRTESVPVWAVVATLAAMVSACAGLPLDPVITDTVAIERIDSGKARIRSVQVRDRDGQLAVSGRLQKRHSGRSPLPGHLHIDAMDDDGNVLATAIARHHPLNPRLGSADFSQVLPVQPERVRAVRVTHHDHSGDEPAIDDRLLPFG